MYGDVGVAASWEWRDLVVCVYAQVVVGWMEVYCSLGLALLLLLPLLLDGPLEKC